MCFSKKTWRGWVASCWRWRAIQRWQCSPRTSTMPWSWSLETTLLTWRTSLGKHRQFFLCACSGQGPCTESCCVLGFSVSPRKAQALISESSSVVDGSWAWQGRGFFPCYQKFMHTPGIIIAPSSHSGDWFTSISTVGWFTSISTVGWFTSISTVGWFTSISIVGWFTSISTVGLFIVQWILMDSAPIHLSPPRTPVYKMVSVWQANFTLHLAKTRCLSRFKACQSRDTEYRCVCREVRSLQVLFECQSFTQGQP